MHSLKHFKNLHLALELLEKKRLFIYDSVDDLKKPLAAFDVALATDIDLGHLNHNYPFPIQHLKALAETCYNSRQRTIEINIPLDSPILELLNSCIAKVERIYDICYGLRSFQIEKMQYEEKIYDFLIAIGVYESDKRHFGGMGHIDWEEEKEKKKKEDVAKKLELIDFAKNNLEEVVHTIHSWARGNTRYDARIRQGTLDVIAVHNLIQAAKNPNSILGNTQTV